MPLAPGDREGYARPMPIARAISRRPAWCGPTLLIAAMAPMLASCHSSPGQQRSSSAPDAAATSLDGPAAVRVAPGQYARAFALAREVLRDAGFVIDRVDARAGVLTTHPKPSAGLATPWDTQQSSLGDEVEDLVAHQRRRVRVWFEAPGSADGAEPDLASSASLARVEVTIERLHVHAWRPSTKSVLLSSVAGDPVFTAAGQPQVYSVPTTRDPALAGRLARALSRRLAGT